LLIDFIGFLIKIQVENIISFIDRGSPTEIESHMAINFEIRELQPFTQAEIWPIIAGYETQEFYAVEKTESELRTVFDIHLISLERPFQASFYEDFTPEECQWYLSLLQQGYCFGAYQDGQLIGFLIGETLPDDQLLRVWEIHVLAEFRRKGVGRALMEQALLKARKEHIPMVMLETQNTNVKAVRFYRSLGFSLEAIDISPPHYRRLEGEEVKQVAFYMKRRLDEP
jgi:ribosomal protein S18 acetylase RimI-like enzyme